MSTDCFLDVYRQASDSLESGNLYLRLSSDEQDLVDQQADPIFGPVVWFKLYKDVGCGIGFKHGDSYLIVESGPDVHFLQGSFWYQGQYYNPELFVA